MLPQITDKVNKDAKAFSPPDDSIIHNKRKSARKGIPVFSLSWLLSRHSRRSSARFGDFLGEHAPKLTLTRACVCKDCGAACTAGWMGDNNDFLLFLTRSRQQSQVVQHVATERRETACLPACIRASGGERASRVHQLTSLPPLSSLPPSLPPPLLQHPLQRRV